MINGYQDKVKVNFDVVSSESRLSSPIVEGDISSFYHDHADQYLVNNNGRMLPTEK